MGFERVHYLQKIPRNELRKELIARLKEAILRIPPEKLHTSLALRLLEARMKNPNAWSDLIKLWYKLDDKFPEIGTILSEYDLDFQNQQALMIAALQPSKKAIQ